MATATSTLNPPIATPTIIPTFVFVGRFPTGGVSDDVVELVGGGDTVALVVGEVLVGAVALVGGGGEGVVVGAVALLGGGGEVELVEGDGADMAGGEI